MSSPNSNDSKKVLRETRLRVYNASFRLYLIIVLGDIGLGTLLIVEGNKSSAALWFIFAALWFIFIAKNRADRNRLLKVIEKEN